MRYSELVEECEKPLSAREKYGNDGGQSEKTQNIFTTRTWQIEKHKPCKTIQKI